jgi:mycothiol synthase
VTVATLAAVPLVEVKRQMRADDVADVAELLAAVQAVTGHRPLADRAWLDLVQGGRAGFAGFLAWEHDQADRPIAYAQVSRDNDSWGLELVVDPAHDGDLGDLGRELLGRALDTVREAGGGHVHWWVVDPTATHEALAAELGLHPGRQLHQMRRPLPVGLAYDLTTRPFEVGRDEPAWLEVNNRAFHWHPEQGGWDLATLAARERKPWFDPAGFLLHERDGRLAGFCWTKIHDQHDPVLGEIYVIAVDPDFHGLGLGRALTLAGLDHLARRDVTVGMLYVEADNTAALRLYEQLGFTVHHTDRAFVADV